MAFGTVVGMTGSGLTASAVSAKIASTSPPTTLNLVAPAKYLHRGLPGEHRLKTNVSMIVGDYSVSVNAFIIRNPDENHQGLPKWLLKRNRRMYAVSYAIDHLGDVHT